MWSRPESFGLSVNRAPRTTLRAKLLQVRPLRAPFVLAIGAADEPDISSTAYLAWCKRQPASPRETLAALRAGRFVVTRDEAFGLR